MPAPSNEEIAADLRSRIRRREWQPGMLINQKQLAEDLGVSRIPVREALQALGSEGLVLLQPGQGARVVELERDDIADLYDLRLALEPGLAADVVAGLSPRDHERLSELARLMADAAVRAGDSDELHRDQWSKYNYDFHEHMYVATGRPHTVRIVLQVMDLVEPYSRLYVHLLDGRERAGQEHDDMVAAIAAADADRLAATIRAHLEGARDHLLDDRLWDGPRFAVPAESAHGDGGQDAG